MNAQIKFVAPWGIAMLMACGNGPATSGSSSGSGTSGSAGSSSTSGAGSSGSTGSTGATPGGQTDGGLLTIPLTGCPLLSYFAPVTIAGQSFTMLLDTGSTEAAVALSSCTTCGTPTGLDPPAGSCSSLNMQGELGFMGGVCSESISVGGEAPNVTVNMLGIASSQEPFQAADCTQQGPPGSLPQYQGILGMGPTGVLDKIGTAADDAYFTELVANGVADDFALLLCSVGGRLWLGGYDPQFASGPPQYTPLSMPTGWAISVTSIGLGAATLGPGDPQSIVDTGTQFYSMPSTAYNALVNQSSSRLTSIFGSSTLNAVFNGHPSCVTPVGGQTQAQIDAALPPMTLTLPSVGGGSFTLTYAATASYLVPATPAGGGALQYCLDVQDSASTGNYSILGGPMMRGYITLFDEANSQLGFVPQATCQ